MHWIKDEDHVSTSRLSSTDLSWTFTLSIDGKKKINIYELPKKEDKYLC